MSGAALSLWVALLGATRIDLLFGGGPLVLTPFLVLSPALVLAGLRSTSRTLPRPHSHAGAESFVLALIGLVSLLTLSAFFAYDLGTSSRRLALLIAQLGLVTVVGLILLTREDRTDILARGAGWGIIGIATCNVLQVLVFVSGGQWGTSGPIDLSPGLYFGVIPRLTGLALDPNLGGLAAVTFTWLAWRFGTADDRTRRLVRVGILCVLLTLSRSAALAGVVIITMTSLSGRSFRVTPGAVGTLAVLVGALLAPYLLSPSGADALDTLGGMLGTRLTFDEGSSSQHTQLILRGLEVGTADVKQLLVGVGYGNAFLETQSFFPGNEYGNFHSLFVTFFAEAGVLAAVVALSIFLLAFRRGPTFRAVIAGLFVFNLFQQSHTEPLTWLLLCLAWVAGNHELLRGPSRGPGHPSEPSPSLVPSP
ncbi:MAG: hypothetical protein OXU33_06265 [Gemmatimonadota bacterium]|nr:hypothetical protein [Gemmatimonadota bacterium]MDE3006148.1 hypothetical protein [Gemmatimonadota bacterium]MDE3013660.1 hypothetical protein [Gemmatimonadota bacterium]